MYMRDFKFFKSNEVHPDGMRLDEMANIPNIPEILTYLLNYCSNNQDSLDDSMIREMEYGRFVFTSVDYPLNTDESGVPIGKLDTLLLFTPNDGSQSFYMNLVQDYDFVTEEYEGFFYIPGVPHVDFTEDTVDNYGNE